MSTLTKNKRDLRRHKKALERAKKKAKEHYVQATTVRQPPSKGGNRTMIQSNHHQPIPNFIVRLSSPIVGFAGVVFFTILAIIKHANRDYSYISLAWACAVGFVMVFAMQLYARRKYPVVKRKNRENSICA